MKKFFSAVLALCTLVIVLTFASPAFAQSALPAPLPDYAGKWSGSWKLNSMDQGDLTMTASAEIVEMSATNAPRFGFDPVPVTITAKESKLKFSAKGADGNEFSGELKFNKERTRLSGWTSYGTTGPIWVDLTKQ